MDITLKLAQEFGLKQEYSQNIIDLLNEGNTIPFIALLFCKNCLLFYIILASIIFLTDLYYAQEIKKGDDNYEELYP